MTTVVAACYGGPEVLKIVQRDKPPITENDVRVRVVAASANPLDWHYLRGSPYLMRLMSGLGTPNDTSVGVDFAGVVDAVGVNVTEFQPGDRVFGGVGGAFGEFVVRAQDRAIAHIPEGVSFEQAAAVPIAGVTALQALRQGNLQPGQSVLINGASGGVGTFAVQIAKAMGADVTGVCSTRNVEMVLSIGADQVVDYKTADFTTLDERYDLIIDNVGNHSVSALTGVLNPAGSLVVVGASKGDWIAPFMGVLNILVSRPFSDFALHTLLAELRQQDLIHLATLMGQGQVRSVIDRRFDLQDVVAAIEYSETGRARGKIIVNVAGGNN
ncbi:MAG: NAD(P)-dependent alcohol dehydrogenase [Lysobacterales bacterium]